jgi:phosphopantetheine adenylyltransferase
VDFAEGEETVTVAPEVDESRLQRGFDPRYLGQILPLICL